MYIREAGSSFTLKFIGQRANGELFAEAYSDPFDVDVGDIYKLDFSTYMGTAFGGEAFSPNPAVAVTDRGGNVISYVNEGHITVQLTSVPDFPDSAQSEAEMSSMLQPAANTVVDIVDGLATFEGLYLNRTGYPYQLTFSCSLEVMPTSLYFTYCGRRRSRNTSNNVCYYLCSTSAMVLLARTASTLIPQV